MGERGERCIPHGAGEFNSMPAISVNRNHAVRAPFTQWTRAVPQLVLLQPFIRAQLHPSLSTRSHFVKRNTQGIGLVAWLQLGHCLPLGRAVSAGRAATCRRWDASLDMQIPAFSEEQARDSW